MNSKRLSGRRVPHPSRFCLGGVVQGVEHNNEMPIRSLRLAVQRDSISTTPGAPPKPVLLGWGSSTSRAQQRMPIRSLRLAVHCDSISTTPGSPPKPVLLWWGSSRSRAQRRNAHSLSASCGPLRFNLHHTWLACNIVTKAAPRPVLRTLHETACDGILMNVSKLLGVFLLRPNVEVVVALLPKMFLR